MKLGQNRDPRDTLTLIVCATTAKDKTLLLIRPAGVEKPDYEDWLLRKLYAGIWVEVLR